MPGDKKVKAKELKRKNTIEALRRIEEFLQKYDPVQHAAEISLRLERLEKLMDTFEEIQSEYEEFDDTDEFMQANLECRAKIEEQYFRVKAGLLTKLPVPDGPATPSTSNSTPQPHGPSTLTNVKLPTITLPEFDGDFNGWLTFHDTFVSMIHTSTEISCVQKFHYLRAALKGEAANLIQSITITANNYAVAWETLVHRYSNKVLLRKKHIRALLKYPKIPNHSVEALHRIVDEFQRHTKVLEQLGEPVDQFSSILMEILEDKLDDASLGAWEESVSSDDNPTYGKMIEFLQKRARVLETILINRPNPLPSKSGSNSSGNKKQNYPRLNINAATESSPSKVFPLCPACEKQKHPLMDCSIFKGMDVTGRLKVVNDKRICSNCFRSDHFARTCRSKFTCKHCFKRHHSMIHPGPSETRQQDADVRSRATPSTSDNLTPASNTLLSAVAAAVPRMEAPTNTMSSTTTKVRVVFDGSAKTSTGTSLNDTLLVGPVVQDDIAIIVVRFRQFPIAIVADAEKMYRQVLMHPADRRLQKIAFRFDSTQPIKIYELATVTYGLAPSSFLATRTLLQLVEDEGANYPNASKAVRKNIYVDDYIGGEFTVDSAIQLQMELTQLMQKGGFRLRKWVSNSPEVMAKIPHELLGTQSSLKFDLEETIKTLGICWEPEADVFRFNVSVALKSQAATKRSMLSAIAQLYDPLGLVSPVIVKAKIMMQHLWLISLNWDDQVTPEVQCKWDHFCQQLPNLASFRIDRCVFTSNLKHAEIHTFADASDAAYGACVYVRSEAMHGSIKVCLLASKSKVAPLKRLSTPRLELCAALVGSRLYEKVILALDVPISSSYFWSDSTVFLQWMKSPPRTWKTFVANRISEIQSTTHGSEWLHVAGEQNPADLVSRGVPANELVDSDKWKYGPSWLREPKSSWPIQAYEESQLSSDELEQKKTTMLAVLTPSPDPLFLRYSRFLRLQNLVGFIVRFSRNARSRPEQRAVGGVLSADELDAAKLVLAKLVQREAFLEEIKLLRTGRTVSNQSKLRLLNPFLDADGIIRVGGRLQMSNETYNVQHQIVIPGFHPFTKLIIKYHHEKLIHGGIVTTLAVVRDEFWPLNGRRAVGSVLSKCFRCRRASPRPIEQPIGQLPTARVTASEAFACTGIDYCGPIYLKPLQRKGPVRKTYICVFVCLSTKAVHLELVGDLSTTAFLMALNRFIWRRNKPKHIYSDNATNFIGAKNALNQLYTMFQPGTEHDRIKEHLAQDGIQWHLIPPRAPNFGGLWEAAVKVAKKQLVRQLGDSLLSYEELTTVLVSIEGSMNSRPLMALSDDPNDCSALTPSHFLVKNMIRPLPEPDVRNVPLNRLGQYQRLQAYSQRFWHQWRTEYLKELQSQYKVNPKQFRIDVGSIVIMKDDSLPPAKWPLARIVEKHSGPDGVTRVVTLKTTGGEFKRAVSKICALPCTEDEFEDCK